MTENKIFPAEITAFKQDKKIDYYEFINKDSNTLNKVPEWCIMNFVDLPSEVLDETGEHIKIGATINLYKKGIRHFYPSDEYPKKKNTKLKPTMSEDSLYEDAILYQHQDIDDLWQMFINKVDTLTKEQIAKGFYLKSSGSPKEQLDFLTDVLSLEQTGLGLQESGAVEYKSSFIHTSVRCKKTDERMMQYKEIFKEIVAFGNSHTKGTIYIGVNNKAEIVGIENELISDTPFGNRADFISDFKNQMSMQINNFAFTSSISIDWLCTDDRKLFCRISIPQWNGDVLLLAGTELYLRDEARKQQLKDNDLIQFVRGQQTVLNFNNELKTKTYGQIC